jgi:hypothetical protein
MRPKKSKGHIGFTKIYEYFKFGKDIWRAPIENEVSGGIRNGARFESTEAAWIYISPKIPWITTKRKK